MKKYLVYILALMACTTPFMWFGLLYGILANIGAPAWMWGLYWAYIPVSVFIAVVKVVVDHLD